MSLQVWLPLTKDTRNQGLLNLPVPYDARTRDTGGKLGQYCYSDNAIYHIENEWLGNEWSLACWVKSSSWGQYNDIILCKNTTDSSNAQFYLSIIGGAWLNIGCNSGSETLRINYTFATNTWYHVAATYDGATLKLYLNGNEIGTKAYTSTQKTGMNNLGIGCRSTNAAGTSATGGSGKRMNDVRIYDHYLSPLEVKEISKGLVLHYSLNRGGWGQENLLKYTKVNVINQNLLKNNKSSAWGKLTLTTKDGYDCYFYPSAQNSTWFSSGPWYTGMKANTTYTYTAWVYFTVNINFTFTSLGHFQVYNSASTASDKAHEDIVSARIYEPSIIVANTWTKVRITFTTNDLANSYFVIYPRFNIGTGVGDLYFRDCKLEESAVPTLWCPNSVDNEYSTMGLNSIIEYDYSGFCNNGTKIGTFTWTSDTPKYQVSTTFDGTNYISTATPGADILTLSCWVKTSKNKSTPQIIVADSTSQLCISFYSGTIITFYASSGFSTGSKCTLGSAYKENDWNHLVVVKTGAGTRKVYCNGVEQTATSNDYWSSSSTGFTVARRETSTPHAFYGKLCDVRAYATALSADDVKSLYNNSAYIDNQGNIYGAIYEEV